MNQIILSTDRIQQTIVLLRGQKVMLDRDLAALYGVETRVLNQAVKRNQGRFPGDFMFTLTREEIRNISQSVTSYATLKHAKNVYAFTEQGVAMLSTVLNSERAIQVNIAIMRTFVQLRQWLVTHEELAKKLAELEQRYDAQFQVVFDAIRQLMTPPEKQKNKIGFTAHKEAAPRITTQEKATK